MFNGLRTLAHNLKVLASADFEGASTSRRIRRWGLSSLGPNQSVQSSSKHLTYRSRDSHRNNPTAYGGVESFVSNLIGRGITPRWNTGDKGLNKEILELWKLSVNSMDWSVCELDFYGLQAMTARTMMLSGDSLGIFRYRKLTKDSLVPLQIQLVEPDHLRDELDTLLPNGNTIRMGIELNRAGRREAYHLYREHPHDNLSYRKLTNNTTRIPAPDVMHVYRPYRPGQLRGWPGMSSVITALHGVDTYDDAELDRKQVAAFFSAFVTTPSGEPSLFSLPGEGDDSVSAYEDVVGLEPGIIQYLRPGQDITWGAPADVGGNYEVWMRRQLLRIAKGMGITYEQLTGDLTNVSYSSIRAGLVEFYRACRQLQAHIIVHKFCRPTTTRWLDIAVATRIIRITGYLKRRLKIINNLWDPDGWDWVDPLKDVKGKQLSVRCGFESRSQVVGELGNNAEEVDDQLQADKERADDKGLVLDTDPSKTTSSGGTRERNTNFG